MHTRVKEGRRAKMVKARDTPDVALYAGGLRASPKNEVAGIAGHISNLSLQIVRPTFLLV